MQISCETLNKFCDFFCSHVGMYFSPEKREEAIPKIQKIVKLFGFENPEECFEFLTKTPLAKKNIMLLAKELTIGETYFFRNPCNFQALQNILLHLVIKTKQKDQTIRIWSAGCCTGEEIYSIAIILFQTIPVLKEWNVLLLGTDINQDFLQKAKEACYKEWSFRTTPELIKKGYFVYHPEKKSYELKREIKEMVSFEYLNLITDDYPSKNKNIFQMDLILCNHVLIYFSKPHIQQVVQRFANALNENGMLGVSDIEVPFITSCDLTLQKFGETQVFKKKTKPVLAEITYSKQKSYLNLSQKSNSSRTKEKENLWRLLAWYQAKEYSKIIALLEEQLFKQEKEGLKNLTEEIMLLTKAYANEGNFPKALVWSEKALTLDKINPLQHYLHAVVLQELDQYDEAILALKRAIFLDPSLAIVHLSLAVLFIQKGKEDEAKRCLRNVFKLLKQYKPEEILPGTDDITAERLKKIAESIYINVNEKDI
jgi:chemotaxis protein methyltransferase CheR